MSLHWFKLADGSLVARERTIHFCFDRKSCTCGKLNNSFHIIPREDGRFDLHVTIPGPQPFDEVVDNFATVAAAKGFVTRHFA